MTLSEWIIGGLEGIGVVLLVVALVSWGLHGDGVNGLKDTVRKEGD